MKKYDYGCAILVNDKPIDEYTHKGNTFIEGRSGSEYTIQLRNSSSKRACFVVSVDGLSIIDGTSCSDNSPGYILNAGETLNVPGFKVDGATGAKFTFGEKDKSYAAESGHGTDNTGVIAARIFREKQAPIIWHEPKKKFTKPRPYGGETVRAASASILRKYGSAGQWSTGSDSFDNSWYSASDVDVKGMVPQNMSTNTATSYSTSNAVHTAPPQEVEETSLGTVFGESCDWQTRTVLFERASSSPDATVVLYYDTRKNLEKRGVKFEKPLPPLPNPFPGNDGGCVPPAGWRRKA